MDVHHFYAISSYHMNDIQNIYIEDYPIKRRRMKRKKDIKVKVTIILIFFRLISHEKKEQM
jgi:hypothetical protein